MSAHSRRIDLATDDPWGFGAPDGTLVEVPAETPVEASAPGPADGRRRSPWRPSGAPVAATPPPGGAAPAVPTAEVPTAERALPYPLGQSAPDIAPEPADQVRLQLEPSDEADQHYFAPRRRKHHLITRALALALAALAGAGSYFWFVTGGVRTPAHALPVGTFVLSSQPPGAEVLVDGVAAGLTPLALPLTPGAHTIVAIGVNGVTERLTTAVDAGESVSRHLVLEAPSPAPAPAPEPKAEEPPLRNSAASAAAAGAAAARPPAPAAGFVTFVLPFDVRLYEGETFLGSNAGERVRVAPGRHTFTLVNQELGFRTEETVVVGAGRSTRRVVEHPNAALSVNAVPWAEVFIAGRSLGETPLANVSLPIGTYQVTLRHPTFGEREVGLTVRLGAPNRLAVDMRR